MLPMDTSSKEGSKGEKNQLNSIMQAPQPHGIIDGQDAEFGEEGDEGEEEEDNYDDYYASGQNTERQGNVVFGKQHDLLAGVGGGTFQDHNYGAARHNDQDHHRGGDDAEPDNSGGDNDSQYDEY